MVDCLTLSDKNEEDAANRVRSGYKDLFPQLRHDQVDVCVKGFEGYVSK